MPNAPTRPMTCPPLDSAPRDQRPEGFIDPRDFDHDAFTEEEQELLVNVVGVEQWPRVAGFFQTKNDLDRGRLLVGIVAHLPAMGPTLYALARHVLHDDVEYGCCGQPGWTDGLEQAVSSPKEAAMNNPTCCQPIDFRAKFTPREELEAISHAEDAFEASLTPGQRRRYRRLRDLEGDSRCNDTYGFVAELQRHFPSMAAAIGCVAGHLCEQTIAETGVCCSETWERFPIDEGVESA